MLIIGFIALILIDCIFTMIADKHPRLWSSVDRGIEWIEK